MAEDPSLPSYQSLAYRAALPNLLFVRDLWVPNWLQNGGCDSLEKAKRFLPMESDEEKSDYEARLIRSPYRNYFKPLVETFSGLLSPVKLDVHVELAIGEERLKDVDLCGMNWESFTAEVRTMAIRDRFAHVLVDHKDGVTFLSLIQRLDILSCKMKWSPDLRRNVISSVVIQEEHLADLGEFGEQAVTRYRWLTPGLSVLLEVHQSDDGELSVAEVSQDVTLFRGEQAMEVPLVLVSLVNESDPFSSELPTINLAELNTKHYQLTSDYYEILRRCNMPIPVRIGVIDLPSFDEEKHGKMTIGPARGVDVPAGGDFKYAEPAGSAVEATRNAISDIRTEIFELSVAFLSESNGAARTATEANMRASGPRSSLQLMAIACASQLEQVLRF